jgi:hypothetical protein
MRGNEAPDPVAATFADEPPNKPENGGELGGIERKRRSL